MVLKAMVLAAGVGTRLDPLTTQIPKPLVPVANKPVMEYIVRLLAHHGFDQISVNLHHLPQAIKNYFGDGSSFGVQFNYLLEETLSGDAGGVRGCMEHLIGDTFLVIMGDLITDVDLGYLLSKHKRMGALATIALKAVDDVSQFGVVALDKNGWIEAFQEKPKPEEAFSNLASTGIYIFESAIFDLIPKTGSYGFGKQLFPDLIKQKKSVLGVPIESYWSDVGTFSQYRQSNFDLLNDKLSIGPKGQKIESEQFILWKDSNADIANNACVEGKLLLGKNSIIKPDAKILGNVVIGDNCIIESGALIQDSIIWSNSRVGSHAKVKNCVLGLDSCVQEGQQIDEEAVIAFQPAHSELPSRSPSIASNKKD